MQPSDRSDAIHVTETIHHAGHTPPAFVKPELPADLCSCFRTKTMNLNTNYRRSAYEYLMTADTAVYHCLRTMASHGPDELDVRPDLCRRGRTCCPEGEAIT